MQQQKSQRNRQSVFLSLVAVGVVFGLTNHALAQRRPTADSTLGAERSIVRETGSGSFEIEGGAQRARNLFHSFREFHVESGGRVYFANPTGVENIFSRVTGSAASTILGTLGVRGGANLFLLNPNGVIFGPNAALDLRGSFVASSANQVNFADGSRFSAVAPSSPALLTVSVPVGLQFGRDPGAIVVRGTGGGIRQSTELIDTLIGLRVPPDRTLALVGGDLLLQGATLKTAGGRIELGSVAAEGTVGLSPVAAGWTLNYQEVAEFGDIRLSRQSVVDASGLGGGDIRIWGRRVTLREGSRVEASTLGAEAGGTLAVTASEAIEILRSSSNQMTGIGSYVYPDAMGEGGNLVLQTDRLWLRDGAQISIATLSTGDAGSLSIDARQVELDGVSADGQAPSGVFNVTLPNTTASGGGITLKTERLILRNGGQISTGTSGSGDAGDVNIAARDIEMVGVQFDSLFNTRLSTSAEQGATGNAGNLTLETERLVVRAGAQIDAAVVGAGNGGNLVVRASDLIELIGTGRGANREGASSLIATSVQPEATGAAGNLTLETRQLRIRDGAQVSASSLSAGAAGNLTVRASESVEVAGVDGEFPSTIAALTQGAGDAGDLRITTERLTIRNGARVSVSSQRSEQLNSGSSLLGQAGNLTIDANSIELENGRLTAETSGRGTQARALITLRNSELVGLQNGSVISAQANDRANGGNITIEADGGFIVATPTENNDIIASAERGSGGNIDIRSQGLFGLQVSAFDTPNSDITASSRFGVDGVVRLTTPEVNPTSGIVELPTEVVDAARQIDQTCPQRGAIATASEFVITGRGGLPPRPSEALSEDAVQVNLVSLDAQEEPFPELEPPVEPPVEQPIEQVVEAQGWVVNDQGRVLLLANAGPPPGWPHPADCAAAG